MKFCDPVRVPANDPIFSEGDPEKRAKMTPRTWYPTGADAAFAVKVNGNRRRPCAPSLEAKTEPPAPVPPRPVVTSAPAAPPVAPAAAPSDPASEIVELRRQAGYWKSMHSAAKQCIQKLRDERVQNLARIAYLEQQLYGKKSESSKSTSDSHAPAPESAKSLPKRSRGQQRLKPGPKRRLRTNLPAVEEVVDLPADQRCCSSCGLAFAAFPGTEDSEVIEIEVKAYRRIIRRRRYRPSCKCGKHKGIICPPPAPKVIPKGNLGVSAWVEILLDKFQSYRPTYRLLRQWRSLGLDLSMGTVTGGLQRLVPCFEPIYKAFQEQTQKQTRWHADETRWLVFTTVENKVGHRWVMWLFHSKEVLLYVLDETRSHEVPERTLGKHAQGIMNTDRYRGYPAMNQVKDGKILLAFCWAHVRRDFLDMSRSWKDQEDWALGWVGRIGELYKCWKERDQTLEHPDKENSEEFKEKDRQIREHVEGMRKQRDKELEDENIHPARKKVLVSMREHWEGLTVFLDHAEVKLDNNQAERDLRGPVVGRKNYYGSGSKWSGKLAAMMFSVIGTLELWKINPRKWLTEFLQECARGQGKPPADITRFLPWNMTEEERKRLSYSAP